MSKHAEKLIILKEHGTALLQRLYNMKRRLCSETERPALMKEKVLEPVWKQMLKDYPDYSDDIEKSKGYDNIQNKMPQILDMVSEMYLTFREVMDWTNTAIQVLEEVANSIAEFQYDLNNLFMTDYFDTLVCYVQLILLVNRIDDRKLIVSLYNLAYFKVNSQTESSVPRVARYFSEVDNPFKKLQEMFFKLSTIVSKSLLYLSAPLERGDFTYLRTKRPLELLSDPDKISLPAVEKTYFELCHHESMHMWVIIGYLCCPEGLGASIAGQPQTLQAKNTRGIDILRKVLAEHYVIPIYGSETVTVHEHFEELFGRFKSTTLALKKERDSIKKTREEAALKSAEHHRHRRTYLQLQLKSLYNMLKDSPGLLGPKFQLVLSALSLARAEIMWYFRHTNVKGVKKWKETHDYLGELLYYVDEVTQLCMNNQSVISTYYLTFLRNLYHKKLSGIFNQQHERFEGQTKKVVESILSDLQNATEFTGLRLNWKRLQSFLSGFQFKNAATTLADFFKTMNKVYVFTRHVDEIEQQLMEFASLKELYYFHMTEVQKMFFDGLHGLKREPLFASSFIRLLNSYPDNAHKFIPEERGRIGDQCVKLAELHVNQLIAKIEEGITQLRGNVGYGLLEHQFGGDKAAARVLDTHLAKVKAEDTPLPGFESHPNHQSVAKMRECDKNLIQLLTSINCYPKIVVHNTEFYPLEYLRNKLEAFVRAYVKEAASLKEASNQKDAKSPQFPPPSKILSDLTTFMTQMKSLESAISINISEIIMKVTFEEFIHLNYTESPYVVLTNPREDNTGSIFAKWYSEFINAFVRMKLLYHPLRKSFISVPAQTMLVSYKAEDYVDMTELCALCSLIGPYGVRVLDNQLLQMLYADVEAAREILIANQQALKDYEKQIYEDINVPETQKRFKSFDSFLAALTKIGGMLIFRRNLYEALQRTVSAHTPLIHSLVANAQSQFPPNVFREERYMGIDHLAADCGLPFNHADHALQTAIAPLLDNNSIWECLPAAFAVMLTSSSWKENEYSVANECWMGNNAHLAIPAMHELLIMANCKRGDMVDVQRAYESIAECCSMTLLHMRSARGFDKQLKNCYIFYDKFVQSTEFLMPSQFEALNPYPLTRAMYVMTYSATQRSVAEPEPSISALQE